MMSRQRPWPRRWLIADRLPDKGFWQALRRLPRGSGVLVLDDLRIGDRRRLRCWASMKNLTIAYEEEHSAARVHDVSELRRACLNRTPLILLSPLHETLSHPDWLPLPRMRAAALARLAGRQLVALGGMDERRFRTVRQLGFVGWAGISAWLSPSSR